jgi:nucleotide-binding universal stress UspA family protein
MKLLLAIDGSYNADLALDSILASDFPPDSSIHAIAVAEPMHKHLDLAAFGIGKMAEAAQKSLEADLQVLLDETLAKLRAKFGDSNATATLMRGNPFDKILEAAKSTSCDLLVVGSHGTGDASGPGVGHNAQSLASKAPCSVKIVTDLSVETLEKGTPEKPAVARRFLIAVNESDNSKMVFDLFSSRPWPADSSFQVISVVPDIKRANRSRFFQAKDIAETEAKEHTAQTATAEAMVNAATTKLKECFPQAQITGHVLIGSPRNLILQVAQDWPADVIVMGAHDHKGMFGDIAGSTASAVVMYARCSVLLVRPKG